MTKRFGAVAQMGERVVRNDEVAGSIPVSSTKFNRINGQKKSLKKNNLRKGEIIRSLLFVSMVENNA